jgi:hypothetical protein
MASKAVALVITYLFMVIFQDHVAFPVVSTVILYVKYSVDQTLRTSPFLEVNL